MGSIKRKNPAAVAVAAAAPAVAQENAAIKNKLVYN